MVTAIKRLCPDTLETCQQQARRPNTVHHFTLSGPQERSETITYLEYF